MTGVNITRNISNPPYPLQNFNTTQKDISGVGAGGAGGQYTQMDRGLGGKDLLF